MYPIRGVDPSGLATVLRWVAILVVFVAAFYTFVL
jgi:hypothetical protein